jgi:para-aminobenzoate synthetase component 1
VQLSNKSEFIHKALHWASIQSHFAYSASNDIEYPHFGFKQYLAIGAKRLVNSSSTPFQAILDFHQNKWLFGFLGYDLKNSLEKLKSENKDNLEFEDFSFFEPEHLLVFERNYVEVFSQQIDLIDEIEKVSLTTTHQNKLTKPQESVTRQKYLSTIQKLRTHIEEGDCYEINFCQEFHGEIVEANPVDLYFKLNEISPNPFSCFQKHNDHYIISASPERFLKKTDNQLISQPIKGTRPRSEFPEEDLRLAQELRYDEKELAENMMIVDLVRNDLARSSKTGTVKVEEIFGIYSFQQVHQMISTITSEKRNDLSFIEVLKNAFPMGSMTGAPKIKVMRLIEQYENTKRGPFSGAAGYISPNGDFDFNVLIRSLFLNLDKRIYSFQVGSAITYDAVPEKEYDECMVKAKAIFSLLKQYQA